MHRLSLPVVVTAALGLAALPAAAQDDPIDSPYAIALVAGASQFDLSGTGTAPIVGLRIDAVLQRWLVAEGALATFRPEEQSGSRDRYTVLDAQLQAQIPGRVVRPYVGVGGGLVFAGGGRGTEVTASVAGGARVAIPQTRLDARGELRVRGIGDSFTGSAAEWTLGFGYRF